MNVNAYSVELKTSELRQNLHAVVSTKSSVLMLHRYYKFLLGTNNNLIIESYIPEFIQRYISLLNSYEPYCINPFFTSAIINQIDELANFVHDYELKTALRNCSIGLQEKLQKLNAVLNGEIREELNDDKLCFPLLEESIDKDVPATGILETVTIKVSKAKDENKFIIIPSEVKIEPRLKEQVEISWQKAAEIVKRYTKRISPYHEVIIRFDKRVGFYRGNSLGAALTLAFIEELLSYYNSPVIIKTGDAIALTGGTDNNGNLTATSKEIIEKKVEIVFFSPIQTFVLPDEDFPFAEEKLKALQEEFPDRKLTLIKIKTFDDLLDSRKLIDIKKQKLIVRAGRGIKKNKVTFSTTTIFALILVYFFFIKMDTNPAYLQIKDSIVFVKNRYNQTLWTTEVGGPYNLIIKGNMLADVNNDGVNEVIISMEQPGDTTRTKVSFGVICYDKRKNPMWSYEFKDFVETAVTKHSTIYQSYVMEIRPDSSRKVLYVLAHNSLYPSAVYRLDAATGKRIKGTLWNAGRINSIIVGDFNEDGKDEVVGTCVNNAYNTSVFFSIDADKLDGQAPANPEYTFKEVKPAVFNNYILLPKTDLTIYRNQRYNQPVLADMLFYKKSKEFGFHILEGDNKTEGNIEYRFDTNLNLILIDYTDSFLMARDKLVKSGKLNPPLTNTVEYRKILENGLRYWDGKGFVRKAN